MIIVDRALEAREREGNPIRVAMVGAGFMGRGIALQILTVVRGMRLVAIANRCPERAAQAYRGAGRDDVHFVDSVVALERAIEQERPAITDDPLLVCRADQVDAVIEATGAVEFSARVVFEAIRNGKHVILMNAELDGTVGPILKVHADRNGVVYSNADGDQPGVVLNLFRFVRGLGVTPVLCGSIKGLHDPYRTPTTQLEFARKWNQRPEMVTSFADGTKISFEQAIVANATGMRVVRRGMLGPTVPTGTPIQEVARLYPEEALMTPPGVVDYVVGASPSPGVFVLGTHTHPAQRQYLSYYKMGEGPFYCFYTPYHLCHFEVPHSVARAVLFHDAPIAPQGAVMVEVVATAKKDLHVGDLLDGIGGYSCYGQCENAEVARSERLLPMGLAEGCTVRRPVPRDAVLTYADVELPAGRIVDRLRAEQEAYFAPALR